MKQIESYHISKSEYGIIQLIINTRDRWVKYGLLNWNYDKTWRVNIFDKDGYTSIDELVIPEAEFQFDKEAEYYYAQLDQQEKDQIIYYWIPIRLLKGDDWFTKFKDKKNEILQNLRSSNG